jgi:8-oxo-dGTP pyrophosphatase MutT (NUDIX family)
MSIHPNYNTLTIRKTIVRKKNTDDSLWRISAPRTLITTPVMNLISGIVHCGRTGIDKDFFKLEFSNWVNIVACTDRNEIVLIRQYRFGTEQVELEIPGGAVNDGEPPLEAGLRELLEETGYAGENGRIIGRVCPNPAIQGNFCYTVLVENVKKIAEPNLDEMEDIEVLTVPEAETFALIQDGSIHHGLVMNGLMFYAMAGKKQFT